MAQRNKRRPIPEATTAPWQMPSRVVAIFTPELQVMSRLMGIRVAGYWEKDGVKNWVIATPDGRNNSEIVAAKTPDELRCAMIRVFKQFQTAPSEAFHGSSEDQLDSMLHALGNRTFESLVPLYLRENDEADSSKHPPGI